MAVAFVVVEAVVSFAAAVDIDAPVATAGLAPPVRALAVRLEDGGIVLPPAVAGALVHAAPDAFVARDGRLGATTRLADTLHLLGDDPVPAIARITADGRARDEWLHGTLDP